SVQTGGGRALGLADVLGPYRASYRQARRASTSGPDFPHDREDWLELRRCQEYLTRRRQLRRFGGESRLAGPLDQLPARLTLERRVTVFLVCPRERGERLHVVWIRQQALLGQLDHPLDTAESSVHFHEDVSKDVFLLAAAAAHGVEVVDRRSHEAHGGLEI